MSDAHLFAGRASDASLVALSRPQRWAVAFAAAAVALTLLTGGRSWWLLLVALLASLAAIRIGQMCAVNYLARLFAYVGRSRWTMVAITSDATALSIVARGQRSLTLRKLQYHGRLDLNGEEEQLIHEVARAMDRSSGEGAVQFLSWHLRCDGVESFVAFATPSALATTSAWHSVSVEDLAEWIGVASPHASGWFFERWTHLRSATEVVSVFAVSGASGVVGESVLARLGAPGRVRELSVQVRVESIHRAATLVGRQSHRWRANLALASLFGFRHRATFEATSHRLDRREREVASGRALAEVAVFVVVRAANLHELEGRVAELMIDAKRSGVRLERGDGRHALWFCAQLPGSPAWSSA